MNLTSTSKFVSLILRHKPETIGIQLDEHGWANVDGLIAGISKTREFNREMLEEIVWTDNKQRFTFNEEHFRVDLVFYNRMLRCFVLFDLKIGSLKHQDLGQMQMYVNYYDRYEKQEDENPTIGVLLCQDKDDSMVELTLPKDSNIFASKYQLYLPDKKLLQDKLGEWVKECDADKCTK